LAANGFIFVAAKCKSAIFRFSKYVTNGLKKNGNSYSAKCLKIREVVAIMQEPVFFGAEYWSYCTRE
jgi:hypothetical protein